MQYQIDVLTAFAERTIKRLWILIILLVILLFGSNAAWLYYESTMQEVTVTERVEQEAEADNSSNIQMVGGDFYGGESAAESNNNG